DIQITLARPAYSPESPVPVLQAGRYTMSTGPLEPADDSPTHIPGGWGVGSLTVSKMGAVRAVGLLADGKPFAIGSQLGETAEIPVYSMMYQGLKGVLAGNLRLAETTGTDDGGTFWWQKPALTNGGFYSAGFNGTVRVELSRWNGVVPQIFRLGESKASLSGGDLPADLNPGEKRSIFALYNLLVLNPGYDQLKLKVDPATGLIQGSFRHPMDGEWHSIYGR